jgi:hypothetical protein
MNRKACGRKQSCPALRYSPGIRLQDKEKHGELPSSWWGCEPMCYRMQMGSSAQTCFDVRTLYINIYVRNIYNAYMNYHFRLRIVFIGVETRNL